LLSPRFEQKMPSHNHRCCRLEKTLAEEVQTMNSKSKLVLGILTALAMLLLTFVIPRGGALRDAQLASFPTTVGIWAIFVLLFVKLK
jgi:hypothetical protein